MKLTPISEIPWENPDDVLIAQLSGLDPKCKNCRFGSRHNGTGKSCPTLVSNKQVYKTGVAPNDYFTCTRFRLPDPS